MAYRWHLKYGILAPTQIIEGHMISHMINDMTSNMGTDLVWFGYVDIDEAIAAGI